MFRSLVLGWLYFVGCCSVGFANIGLPNVFGSNMVLQQGKEVPIWGWGAEGEKVTVEFAGQKVATVCKGGRWGLSLKPLKAGGPFEMTVKGDNTIVFANVLVGEVWICSGQSNMEWALSRTTGGDSAIANSANDKLRILGVPHNVKNVPDSNFDAKWTVAGPATTKLVSAVGYHFLSRLQKELNVPVGMINMSFGGTVIESWISKEVLDNMPFKDRNMSMDSARQDYDKRIAKVKPIIDAYERAKDSAKRFKLPNPPRPAEIPSEFKGPTTIYNGEVAPLGRLAVRGVAWYQGESNAYPGRANTYGKLLPAMIALWRRQWADAALPFIIVQLSGDRSLHKDPVENSGIAVVKEAQLKTVANTPNTALVTTHDCGELNVHYVNKAPVGARVFGAALNLAYGRKTEFTGPLYKSLKIEGNKAVLTFDHVGSGLVVRTDTAKPAELFGFAVAGKDRQFHWGKAKIEGNKVAVTCPEVAEPVAVRYGWANFSFQWNLYNKEGHPASSFRTDDWELPEK